MFCYTAIGLFRLLTLNVNLKYNKSVFFPFKNITKLFPVYLASSISFFTGLLITRGRILDCFAAPERVDDGGNERVEDGFQEPLVDPQQDGNHNAGNANHGCASDK